MVSFGTKNSFFQGTEGNGFNWLLFSVRFSVPFIRDFGEQSKCTRGEFGPARNTSDAFISACLTEKGKRPQTFWTRGRDQAP
jgi:hypothetical protein